MARRRRRRFTWFPTLGTGSAVANADYSGRQLQVGVDPAGGANMLTVPLTFDAPQEVVGGPAITADTPLGDFIGNEYLLERIVGNMFVSLSSASFANTGGAVLVTSGLFVARSDDQTVDQPIGSAAIADEIRNYSPQHPDNIREPWIFRRSWILGHHLGVNPGTGGVITSTTGNVQSSTATAFPQSNVFYGTAAGGPFVDAKSARRVGTDERLFWTLTCQSYPINTLFTGATIVVTGYFDYRILGTLLKPHNRSTF